LQKHKNLQNGAQIVQYFAFGALKSTKFADFCEMSSNVISPKKQNLKQTCLKFCGNFAQAKKCGVR